MIAQLLPLIFVGLVVAFLLTVAVCSAVSIVEQAPVTPVSDVEPLVVTPAGVDGVHPLDSLMLELLTSPYRGGFPEQRTPGDAS